jgi:O-methyltransferase
MFFESSVLTKLKEDCRRDGGRALSAVAELTAALLPSYKLKWPQVEWMANPQFNTYLRTFGEEFGFNADRRWMIYQLARLTSAVAGDTAECGAFKGAGSHLICLANRHSALEKTHHVFDSFEGLSQPNELDGRHWKQGDLACGLDLVKRNLAQFPRVEYHKGWIPERFGAVSERRFSFLHIDVDLYEPTRDSIRFFYERMSPGGIILCDDYGFSTCPGATQALEEFLQDKPERVISLSGGGGFLIRGITTAPDAFAS